MSTTVVDALVVTLGLDPSNFTKGQKAAAGALLNTRKEASATAKDMEAKGKQAAQFFTKIRNEALTFFAVFTAGVGLKNFIADTITGTASLGRMSQNLGMSTQDLASWQKAAERAGGSAEGMTAQLRESASEVAKYKAGMAGEGVQWFFRFGGNPDALKDGNTYLLARARIISDIYAKDPARAGVVAGQMGISDDQFNLIKQGPAAILKLVEAQRKNAVVTAKDAEEADKLRIKLLDLRDTLQATATKILLTLAPVLERWLEQLQELADWVAEHRDDIAAWLETAVREVIAFGKALDKGAESVGGWKTILIALVALNLTSTIAQFVALAGAILGVGKALGVAGASTAAASTGSGLFAVLKKLGVGAALLLHTDEVGAGEMEELARRRAIGDKQGPYVSPPGAYNPSGTSNEVMDKLMGLGWTRDQAAGIAANLKKESEFKPTAVGDGGKAYGIAQWHPDRQAEFKKKFGKDIQGSTLDEQLAFVDYELREGKEKAAGDKLKNATSAANAGAIVSKYYERPADTAGEMSGRAQLAQQMAAAEAARSAAWVAANPERAQAANAGAGRGFAQTSTTATDIQIGKIEVVTQATDADGIAKDIGKAVKTNSFVTQANTGLN